MNMKRRQSEDMIEFERLPVHVLYRNAADAVIDVQGPLKIGDVVGPEPCRTS